MQKYQSWFNSDDDDQDLNMFLRETRKGLMGGRASAAVHVGKRCLYYFLVMMILNYSRENQFLRPRKIRVRGQQSVSLSLSSCLAIR